MTLDKYHLPYNLIYIEQDDKEIFKRTHNIESFPQIYLILQRKSKKSSRSGSTLTEATGTTHKIRIGSDQEFQLLVRLAYEIKNKKIDMNVLTAVLNIL
jgi:hypothetical protein